MIESFMMAFALGSPAPEPKPPVYVPTIESPKPSVDTPPKSSSGPCVADARASCSCRYCGGEGSPLAPQVKTLYRMIDRFGQTWEWPDSQWLAEWVQSVNLIGEAATRDKNRVGGFALPSGSAKYDYSRPKSGAAAQTSFLRLYSAPVFPLPSCSGSSCYRSTPFRR
jgi:hypothetical protein